MLNSDAKYGCRQSVLQKAAGYGEGALKIFGAAKSVWDTSKAIYGAAQAAAPYIEAGLGLL